MASKTKTVKKAAVKRITVRKAGAKRKAGPVDVMRIERDCARLSLDYSHFADTHQHAAWAALFARDAELALLGQVHKGRAAILASVANNNRDVASVHSLHNIRIEVVSATEAKGTVGVALFAALKVNGVAQAKDIAPVIIGNYHDAYRNTNEGWRFARREFVTTISRAQS